ncbi:hypothetical protein CRUP_017367 [Coryphaenoides rupestris]|nr:hypothetical protein CRUP_017367 [Coryphaenoides rupestris]
MFLANKRLDNQVKTYITFNRGRDWRLLQAPSTDLRGNNIHCVLPGGRSALTLLLLLSPPLQGSGEPCLMGVKRIYRKLKPLARCVMGKRFSVAMTSAPCDCTEADFECSASWSSSSPGSPLHNDSYMKPETLTDDYGYDRRMDGKCSPAFWFHPSSMSRSCTTGTTFLKSTGLTDRLGSGDIFPDSEHELGPALAPRGLHLVTGEGTLTATLATNVTFLVFLEEVHKPNH